MTTTAAGPRTTSAPQVEVVDDLDRAEALAAEWDELAGACGAGPSAWSGYALTWWRHLGRGRLLVVVVRRDGRLVALAPLHERRAGPVGVVRWLGHGIGTVAELLVHPGAAGAGAAEALWAALDSPRRVLQLTESRDGGPGLDAFAAGAGRRTTVERRDRCPVVDPVQDAATHLAHPDRRRMRRTVRVAERRLDTAGASWQVEVADDPASWAALLPAVAAVYDESEAAKPRIHLLSGRWAAFTEAFLADAFESRRALALVGFLDDADQGATPVCFDLLLLSGASGSAATSWVGRFAPRAASWSPGHLLQAAGLDHLAARGVVRLDLGLGDDDYKRRWATGGYDTLEVLHGRRPVVTGAAAVLRRREHGSAGGGS